MTYVINLFTPFQVVKQKHVEWNTWPRSASPNKQGDLIFLYCVSVLMTKSVC